MWTFTTRGADDKMRPRVHTWMFAIACLAFVGQQSPVAAEPLPEHIPERIAADEPTRRVVHRAPQQPGKTSRSTEFGSRPLKSQRAYILRHWESRSDEGRGIRSTAALVRDSTLPIGEKRAWFEKLLAEAREIQSPRDRAALLSGLGMALGIVDPQMSLRVHSEELAIARALDLKPDPWHDWIDDLGTMFPLASADEVFRFTFSEFRGDGHELVKVLWLFARKLDAGDDRDAVLEGLARVLIEQQDYPRAAGTASLVAGRARQVKLLADIAAAQSDAAKP